MIKRQSLPPHTSYAMGLNNSRWCHPLTHPSIHRISLIRIHSQVGYDWTEVNEKREEKRKRKRKRKRECGRERRREVEKEKEKEKDRESTSTCPNPLLPQDEEITCMHTCMKERKASPGATTPARSLAKGGGGLTGRLRVQNWLLWLILLASKHEVCFSLGNLFLFESVL